MLKQRHTSWMDGVMDYVGSDWHHRESLNTPYASLVDLDRAEHQTSNTSECSQWLAFESDGRAGIQTSTISGFLAALAGLKPPTAASSQPKKREK